MEHGQSPSRSGTELSVNTCINGPASTSSLHNNRVGSNCRQVILGGGGDGGFVTVVQGIIGDFESHLVVLESHVLCSDVGLI